MFRDDQDLYLRLTAYQRFRAYAIGYLFLLLAGSIVWDIGKIILR